MARRAGTWFWRSCFLGALVLGAVVILLGSPAIASTTLHVWEMDEPDGTGTMVDTGAPTQTNGTWLNIEAGVDGFIGTAYRFDGSSRVTVGDDDSLDPLSRKFVVTVHVKFATMPDASVGGDFDLIRKGLGSTSGGYWKVEIFPNSKHTKAMGLCQMKGATNAVKIKGAPESLNHGNRHTITCMKTDTLVRLTLEGTSYPGPVWDARTANGAVLPLGSRASGDDWYIGDMDSVTYQIG